MPARQTPRLGRFAHSQALEFPAARSRPSRSVGYATNETSSTRALVSRALPKARAALTGHWRPAWPMPELDRPRAAASSIAPVQMLGLSYIQHAALSTSRLRAPDDSRNSRRIWAFVRGMGPAVGQSRPAGSVGVAHGRDPKDTTADRTADEQTSTDCVLRKGRHR